MQDRTTSDPRGGRRTRAFGIALGVACVLSLGSRNAWADPPQCEFPGQKQMLLVQLFMGLDMPSDGLVSPTAWNSFLGSVVTPLFPDGFTVYDAYGQWWNPQTRSIVKEPSKVIVIVVADSQGSRAKISKLSDAYKREFRQISVGVVSGPTCAAF